MDKSQAKDLFQLQSNLIDMKVDMSVNNAMEKVLNTLTDIRGDIHKLENRFTSVEHRIKSTKAALNAQSSVLREVRTKFIDFSFRAGGLALAGLISYLFVQLHPFFK